MANKEHLEILNQGVKIWNRWRRENPGIRPDIGGADISYADLVRADLRGVFLREVRLNGAHLIEADLKEADLLRADLSGAHLIEADLSNSDLRVTRLIGTYLSGANLSFCHMGWTILAATDLSQVKGLETVKHSGPSSIGLDTLSSSEGKIPEVFLRGSGVPEIIIKNISPINKNLIQYYSCFISYSSKDQELAEQLHADLQSNGVRCWFAPEDVKGGRKLHEQIPEAIRLYDKLLLVLSENSMASEWVKTEIYHARQDEIRNNKRKLFPIGLVAFDALRQWEAFDADVGKDMAREVREYFIPDFSNWKDHDSYKKAYDRLLRDLKAPERAGNPEA